MTTTPLPAIIAGAIYDFAGFLTTREATACFGSTENAAPAAELVKEWLDMRSLGDAAAAVQTWEQARADLEAENADLKRKLAEASNTLCIGGQMISAIAAALKGSNHD